jgi:hypothetical protein
VDVRAQDAFFTGGYERHVLGIGHFPTRRRRSKPRRSSRDSSQRALTRSPDAEDKAPDERFLHT